MVIEQVNTAWKGFVHQAVAALSVLGGMLLVFKDQLSDWGVDIKSIVGDYVPAQYTGYAILGIGLFFGALRYLTTTQVLVPPTYVAPTKE